MGTGALIKFLQLSKGLPLLRHAHTTHYHPKFVHMHMH